MKNHINKVVLVLMLFIMMMSSTAIASESNGLTEEDKNTIKNTFEEAGVDPSCWDQLIAKIERGELLDCFAAENGEDVMITESYLDDGTYVKRYTYPDGSVNLFKFKPGTVVYLQEDSAKRTRASIQVMDRSGEKEGSVTGGVWHSGSGYAYCTDAYVSATKGFCTLEFLVDYEFRNNGSSRINDFDNEGCVCRAGTHSNLRFEYDPNELIGGAIVPAVVQLKVDYHMILDAYSETYTMTFSLYDTYASVIMR